MEEEDERAGEVAAELEGLDARVEDGRCGGGEEMLVRGGGCRPACILCGDVHGTLERPRPLNMRTVVMRMTYHNCPQPAHLPNPPHRLLIQQRDAIPQHIPLLRLQQQRPLPNAKLGRRVDRHHPLVAFIRRKHVGVRGKEGRERGEGRAGGGNVLARVVADEAGGEGGAVGGGELGAAC